MKELIDCLWSSMDGCLSTAAALEVVVVKYRKDKPVPDPVSRTAGHPPTHAQLHHLLSPRLSWAAASAYS